MIARLLPIPPILAKNEIAPARHKAKKLGVKQIFIEDLREEFARDYIFPMFRGNAQYETDYLLGTSIARPLIAKRLVNVAKTTGADAIAHGATGKGNDQVRFELSAYAINPKIKVIAPWRDWELLSREKLLNYAKRKESQSTLNPEKNHLIRWMQISYMFHMKAASLKIQVINRKIKCGE